MSTSKSCYMSIGKREDYKDIELLLYGKPLEQIQVFKYLGMWLDGRYTWKKHFEEIDKNARIGTRKRLNANIISSLDKIYN